MSQMSRADAELVYQYVCEAVRGDIEAEAFDRTLNEWQAERSDELETLEDAHQDETSSFQWKGIYFETSPDHDGDLVPITGVATDESEIDSLVRDFGWDYLNAIRAEVRSLQDSTNFSPREFVALVLDAADNVPEDVARREMGISLGNYRGKKGSVSDKLDTAKKTIKTADRIRP